MLTMYFWPVYFTYMYMCVNMSSLSLLSHRNEETFHLTCTKLIGYVATYIFEQSRVQSQNQQSWCTKHYCLPDLKKNNHGLYERWGRIWQISTPVQVVNHVQSIRLDDLLNWLAMHPPKWRLSSYSKLCNYGHFKNTISDSYNVPFMYKVCSIHFRTCRNSSSLNI